MKSVNIIFVKYIVISLSLILCGAQLAAGSPGDNSSVTGKEIIIAKVAGREITLKDFIERSEYTLRPLYCRGSFNNDKNIVLNTLIAEKLLALEADNNLILNNEEFSDFITGRREQKMRELLYVSEGVNKVSLDTAEIKHAFSVAGRTYKVQYFNINDNKTADSFLEKSAGKDSLFENIFYICSNSDSIRSREINWYSPETDIIHKTLFSGKLKKDQILGPVYIDDSTNLLIKITGWNDRVVLSEGDIKNRYNDVVEKLTYEKADSIYDDYILSIMGNKRVDFDIDVLNKLVTVLAPFYLNRKQEAKNDFLDLVNKEIIELPDITQSGSGYGEIADQYILKIDNEIWTVSNLKKEIDKHPLVFRKDNSKDKFANQLRLAIVDLIRDKCLTDEAYKRNLHENKIVRHYEQLWRDAGYALLHRDNYLKKFKIDKIVPEKILDEHLNPYVKRLMKKYSDQIEINVDEYNKIKLTRIDMFTTQSNVPFPVYVPAFPLLTTYNRLDYGTKMEEWND